MTIENENFVLSVIEGGTITFSESGRNWTFAGTLQNLTDYTDSLNAVSSAATSTLVANTAANALVSSQFRFHS